MLNVIGCITQDHNYWLVALAAAICICGSMLTIRVFARLKDVPADRRLMNVFLAGVIGGATIWTTHFVAMVAYDPGVDHAYEPILTALSLFIAIAGVSLGLALASTTNRSHWVEAGGAVFGLTVATMHYVGMHAYQIPGRITWDNQLIATSILLGSIFGAIALNQAARPVSKYSLHFGVGAMAGAICLMHFTGMSAIKIDLDPLVLVPPKMLSDTTLIILVVAVMSLFLFVGLAAHLNEKIIEQNAGEACQHAKLHDPLTGLPNRSQLSRYLDRLCSTAQSDSNTRFAIVTIDLDRFKEINDMHGHAAGDATLEEISERLLGSISEGEFVARTGGDEFVAIKSDYTRLAEVSAFAERLLGRIVEPIMVGALDLSVGASIGIASYPEHGEDLKTLLSNSDLAMYRAKDSLLDTICFFDEVMDQENREKIALANDLRTALTAGHFELNYQQQNDVETREVVGFEALLRWNHPVRGRVPPADFIPIAEKTGLIRSIGRWVLATACKEAASWNRPYPISVNVTPQELVQPSFVENVANALSESGLEPSRLELEITEASIIDDQKNTLEVMRRLKELGIRIAMDDFGTGYSSLASLKSFPFDKIKIDRSFIDRVQNNPQSAAIVRSTLLLGEALEIPILAEGVETEDELGFLFKEHCSEVQGFLFGRPMSVEEVRSLTGNAEAKNKVVISGKSDTSIAPLFSANFTIVSA